MEFLVASPAGDELVGNLLGEAGEEGLGEGLEALGGRGGYGGGLEKRAKLISDTKLHSWMTGNQLHQQQNQAALTL